MPKKKIQKMTIEIDTYCDGCGGSLDSYISMGDKEITAWVSPCETCLNKANKDGYKEGKGVSQLQDLNIFFQIKIKYKICRNTVSVIKEIAEREMHGCKIPIKEFYYDV